MVEVKTDLKAFDVIDELKNAGKNSDIAKTKILKIKAEIVINNKIIDIFCSFKAKLLNKNKLSLLFSFPKLRIIDK